MLKPSGSRGNTSGYRNTRERLQAKLAEKRHEAKIAGVGQLMDMKPEFYASFLAAEHPEQRDKILTDFCKENFDKIISISTHVDRGLPLPALIPPTPQSPAEVSSSQTSGKASSSQALSESSSSQTLAGPSSPRIPARSSSSQTLVESSSPRTPAESSSSQTLAKSSSSQTLAESSSSQTLAKSSSSQTLAKSSSSQTLAEPFSPSTAGRAQPTEGRSNEVPDFAERLSLGSIQSKSAGPVPTGWSLNEARPRSMRQLSNKAEKKANLFMNYIRQGLSPADAATKLGPGSMLKALKTSKSADPSTRQYEIRLNQHDRLTFMSDDVMKNVTILEIGGHT